MEQAPPLPFHVIGPVEELLGDSDSAQAHTKTLAKLLTAAPICLVSTGLPSPFQPLRFHGSTNENAVLRWSLGLLRSGILTPRHQGLGKEDHSKWPGRARKKVVKAHRDSRPTSISALPHF